MAERYPLGEKAGQMSIVWMILKIIGILLLILLLLAAVLLFHPVFYCVRGEIQDEASVQGRIWWLLRILRLEFAVVSGEVKFHFFIFGREMSADEAQEQPLPQGRERSDAAPVADTSDKPKEAVPIPKEAYSEAAHSVPKEAYSGGTADNAVKKKRKYRRENRRGDWKARAVRWKEELSDERNHQAVSHLFQEICYLLRHLKPRSVSAELSFCAGDPAVTGQITGALSLFPVIYRYHVHIYPDFMSEDVYIRGNFAMKGHMALYHLLRMLFRIWKDNNVMRLYKKIRS